MVVGGQLRCYSTDPCWLDVPYALIHGLLELIDLDIECKIVIKSYHLARPNLSTQCSDPFQLVNIEEDSRVTFRSEGDNLTTLAPSAQPQNQSLTLQNREAGGRRKAQRTIPLCISETIKHMLKPGRNYRLQTTSTDIGVK